MAEIQATVKAYIEDEFVHDGDIEIDDEVNLLEEEVIDSLGIFTLVAFIEQKFGVAIDAEEVKLDNFETLPAITKLIESKLG